MGIETQPTSQQVNEAWGKANQAVQEAAKQVGKAVQDHQTAAAAAVGGAGAAAAAVVQSALDSVDTLHLQALKERLQEALKATAGERMVDQALKAIIEADHTIDHSSGPSRIGAWLQAAAVRMKFAADVAGASTEQNRAARDHAVNLMMEPNNRATEEALKFILDTINETLDKRADKPQIVPVPVPIPFGPVLPLPFCGTTALKLGKR